MADALNELIKSGAEKAIDKSACVFTAPCTVVSVNGNQMYTVKLVTSDAQYTVRNYSGSDLAVGESCQLFYRNNIISNQTAYIGAAANKNPFCLNGLSLVACTQTEYDNMDAHDAMTLFFIYEEGE